MESNKKFTIHVPFECSLIECTSKNCGMKYILHAVITSEGDDNTCGTAVMPQDSSYFCPYCGAITKEKEKRREQNDRFRKRVMFY